MRPSFAIAIVAAWLGAGCAPRAAVAIPTRPRFATADSHTLELSLKLLDEAHQISRAFRLEQRAWIVFDATKVAAPLDSQRGKQWALEAWELSKQLEPGQSRAALQKDACANLRLTTRILRFGYTGRWTCPQSGMPSTRRPKILGLWDTRIPSSNRSGSVAGNDMRKGSRVWLVFWERRASILMPP